MNNHINIYPYGVNYQADDFNDRGTLFYRLFDILFSSLAIIALSPLLIVVAVVLKLTNDDDIFYRQERVGLGGQLFSVYKFTTMIKNSENMGSGTITVKNDVRVFPFGKFLRKTKINELPQLFNILLGDMSVVGPRPLPMDRYSTYSDEVKRSINTVLPGLSGVGSIFFRNEEEILNRVKADDKVKFYDRIIAPYKGRVEQWYVSNNSPYLYFMVIFMTVYMVLFPNAKIQYNKFFKRFPTPPKELRALS